MQSRSVSRAGFGILASIIFLAAGLSLAPAVGAQEIEWTRQFGTASFEFARGISVDASGIYVAGRTGGTLPGQTSAGGVADAFVRKYDANGNEVWTRQFGTSSSDLAFGISVDASGVYVAGSTGGTLPSQTSAGSFDAFVRKYDANGTEVWTRQFGSSLVDQAVGISVDASGVYVAGLTAGTLPGQTSAGSQDAFVRQYDANGTEVWTRQFGTASSDLALGISVDASGIYVAGVTRGTLLGQTSAGSRDAFVRKYDANGTEVWTRQFGSSSDDRALGIAVDAPGIYVAGITAGTLPGQTSAFSFDAFVVKLSILTPAEAIQQLIADVVALNLKQGFENSLNAKLDAAVQALDDLNQNNDVAAINVLQAFINAVEAQRGVHIPEPGPTT